MYSFGEIREAILSSPPGGKIAKPEFKGLANATHFQELPGELKAAAKRMVNSPQPELPFSLFQLFETQGSRIEFETPYFDRRSRLAVLTLVSLLDDTGEYIPTIENEIWQICLEYSWALPAHLPVGVAASRAARVLPQQTVDLFASETAHQLAETLAWLRPRLNPWIEYRVREEIERRIYRPYFYDPHHFWWEDSRMNWAAVCAGAVGIAALTLETDRERLAGMLERIMGALGSYLEGFGDDGGSPEGISYWVYGFGYFVYFAETLRDYTGGKLDLLDNPKVKRIANFPNSVSLGGTNWVNYSDAPAQLLLETGLISRLAGRLGVTAPALEKVPLVENSSDHPRFRWAHLTRNLLWTEPNLFGRPTRPGAYYLPDIQWVVSREYFGPTLVGFSAKGGHNDEPHNHNDLGHFLLFAGEESLLCELGAGLYTRDYFREKRYTFFHPSSLGHSVPVINGQAQQHGAANAASVLQEQEFEDHLIFELDLSWAYPPDANLSKFTRKFEYAWSPEQNQSQLALTDTFGFSGAENSVSEAFISLIQPELTPENVLWQGQQGRVTLTYDLKLFETRLETVRALAKDGNLIDIFRLCLDRRSQDGEIANRFLFTCAVNPA